MLEVLLSGLLHGRTKNALARVEIGFDSEELVLCSLYGCIQVLPIYGGKAEIVRTQQSGGYWHFRMWISEESKYVRKTLKTKLVR